MVRRVLAGIGVLLLVFGFMEAGFWQLRRHAEKRAYNQRIEERTAFPPAEISALLAAGAAPSALEFRRATATGRYDVAREIVLDDHPLNDVAGNHVLTPLVRADGTAVLVDRGWVPLQDDTPPIAEASPPHGTVTVTGIVFRTQVRKFIGPRTPATGTLTNMFRIEIPRVQQQVPYRLAPMWLQLQSQSPAQAELPKPVPVETLPAGPHLSYAAQWFAFAFLAIVGYVALTVRSVRSARARLDDAERGPEPAPVQRAEP